MSNEPNAEILEIVRRKGLRSLPEPVQLASGFMSRYFIDAKAALAHGDDLAVACRAMIDAVNGAGIEFDAVGGLTLGADQFSHGVALVAPSNWFVVRKAAKGRGTNQLIEGAPLGQGVKVLLVDDIVTTGGSIKTAFERVSETGATVVAASTLADRGRVAGEYFASVGVPYFPLMTYVDLGIPEVGTEEASQPTA